jgi:G3E family GTPase
MPMAVDTVSTKAEQVEAANVIVINKVDIADGEQVEVATAVAKALNEKATVVQAEFGKIPTKLMLQIKRPSLSVADHHDHSHQHSHGDDESAHQHTHDHACNEPDCTDETHSHSHSHFDDHGITNFVYTATTPFHIDRLMKLLSQWPVPIKDELDAEMLEDGDSTEYEGDEDTPFTGVIRSKGFCWFAPRKWSGSNSDAWRHDAVMYWSHAGKQFGIAQAGQWWATLPDDKLKMYLANHPAEYHRIKTEDFKTTEFGDRRQELVFIGTELRIDEITLALNSCLLSARELDGYRQRLEKYKIPTSVTA